MGETITLKHFSFITISISTFPRLGFQTIVRFLCETMCIQIMKKNLLTILIIKLLAFLFSGLRGRHMCYLCLLYKRISLKIFVRQDRFCIIGLNISIN